MKRLLLLSALTSGLSLIAVDSVIKDTSTPAGYIYQTGSEPTPFYEHGMRYKPFDTAVGGLPNQRGRTITSKPGVGIQTYEPGVGTQIQE